MFEVRFCSTVYVNGRGAPTSVRILRGDDLTDLLVQLMTLQDAAALRAIGTGPLLLDGLMVTWAFRPAIPRDKLSEAWQSACSKVLKIIDILPEEAEEIGQVSQALPSVSGIAGSAGGTPAAETTSWKSAKKGGRSNG